MKKQVAILVDAEWFRKVLGSALFRPPATNTPPASPRAMLTAEQFYRNACKALDPTDEELFRFFCYDCEPFDKPQRNPVDLSWIRFGKGHPVYEERMRFYQEIAAMPFVALRRGAVKGRGWEIKESVTNQMIGMDFATLSLKRLVHRIILLSGDTDMVPAIKLARREGIQICVAQVGTHGRLAPALIEDADLVRTITPVL